MRWPYSFTLSSWLLTAITVCLFTLAWVAWRNRRIAGALPFAFCLLFTSIWAVGALCHSAAADVPTQIFWTKFQTIWQMPTATAYTCFVLEYAQPGRWLTRRNIVILSIPVLLVAAIALTNDFHHWLWTGFDASGQPSFGPADRVFTAFSLVLLAVNLVAFIWLFVRSPQHRWPVALMAVGQIWGRAFFVVDRFGVNVSGQLEPFIFISAVPFGIYTIALFGFRIFDPLPLARATAIEEMQEGMLVTSVEGVVLYLNPTAEKMLASPMKSVRGRDVSDVLPPVSESAESPEESGEGHSELRLGGGDSARYFLLWRSPLIDRRDVALGHLFLLHDVTEQRRAQARLLEQQMVVATLQERQRLARELHDDLGQTLGYISMQAQAVRKRALDGGMHSIEGQLAQLADAARDAHKEIRDSILNLKTGPAERWSFFAALREHLAAYRDRYGIRTALCIPDDLAENDFEAGTGAQLLRVIQEALTNARKHGQARHVEVSFAAEDSRAQILIADDGCGFDTERVGQLDGSHFGITFMRERMTSIGGRLEMETVPGTGTRVLLHVPIRSGCQRSEQ